jgi:hypothetical protein
VTIGVDLSLVSLLDIATRTLLLLISVIVLMEFLLLRAEQRLDWRSAPLLHAIIAVVGTTGLSLAYYLIIQATPAELYTSLIDWGFIVQAPRLWAMCCLLRVIRGRM